MAWTTVISSEARGNDGRAVEVAAGTGNSRTVLQVIVQRDRRGRWTVPQPPAIVGGPPASPRDVVPPELEVDDKSLTATATRFVRHYLAGEDDDLSADLLSGVAVSTPRTGFRVKAVEAVTWAQRPRRVAVAITARSSSGRQLALRYELSVVRASGRWLVAGVDTSQPDREVTP